MEHNTEHTSVPEETPVVSPVIATTESQHVSQSQSEVAEFPSFQTLIMRMKDLYMKHYKLLMSLALFPAALSFMISMEGEHIRSMTGDPSLSVSILYLLSVIILAYFAIWTMVALIKVSLDLSTDTAVQSGDVYFKNSQPLIGKFFVLTLLRVLIIVAGIILIVIPGFIFAVWFGLAGYVLIAEGLGIKDSLKKSKAYVAGRFWPVVGRSLLLIIVYFVSAILISIVINLFSLPVELSKQLSALVLGIIWTPLLVLFGTLIYKYLKETFVART